MSKNTLLNLYDGSDQQAKIEGAIDDIRSSANLLESNLKSFAGMAIPTGSILGRIIEERRRQVAKGFTPEHNDKHAKGEIAQAALFHLAGLHCVAQYPLSQFWDGRKWKPYQDDETMLVEAAALIIAELERRERARVCNCTGFDKGVIASDCPEHGEAVQKARLHEFMNSTLAEPWTEPQKESEL